MPKRPSSWTKRRLGTLEVLEARRLLAADPIITEFSASHDDLFRDAFGETPDWIEVFNTGDQTVDLQGYHLTDDRNALDKWAFPVATPLAPGEYLVVMASGRDLVTESGELHTNFRLRGSGEYLALTSPAEQTLSQFDADGSNYPRQFPDIAYGIGQTVRQQKFVGATADVEVIVPTLDAETAGWTAADYVAGDDWLRGEPGVGFDAVATGRSLVDGGVPILQLDINDDDSGEVAEANTEEGWQTFSLADNHQEYDGIRVSMSAMGGVPLEDRDRAAPVDSPPGFTLDQLYDDFVFARSQTNGTGLEVRIEGLTPGQEYRVTLWSFDTGSIGSRVSNWSEVSGAEPVVIESSYSFTGTDAPSSNRDHTISAQLIASAEGELRIQGVRNGGTSYGVFLNALQIVVPTAIDLVNTDVQAPMYGVSSSAFARFPFQLVDASGFDQMSLEMQYDAGFVAYLNAQEVLRQNVPAGELGTEAKALSERTLDQTVDFQRFDLTSHIGLLQDGPNVLAIHGLNSEPGDVDFLIAPRLSATQVDNGSTLYLGEPTPGAPNQGQTFKGLVSDTSFSVDRGFYDAAFEVVVTADTPGATIAYTTDGSIPSPSHGTQVVAVSDEVAPVVTIGIDKTTTLRAMAFRDEYLSTNVDTHTYVFLDQVLTQDPQPGVGTPNYPTRWQSTYTGDYQMDPEVVAEWNDLNPENDDFGIRESLLSLPTMSIVMDHDDLWGQRGIYNNATSQGTAWRRAASIEYFDPATDEEFQVNAGVQMHGGASRDNLRTKKHSFRVVFKEEFNGPSELNFPLFKDSPLNEINTFVLKSFFTDGFPTRTQTGRYSPVDSQYLRDTWMRDVRHAMGTLDAHSEYVHLYINGLYWGLYSPTERPDDAFLAGHLGGNREDYDIVKDFDELFRGSKTSWNRMFRIAGDDIDEQANYQLIQGNNPDGTQNPELTNYLDVDNLIDYMIQHLYAGPEDWPHHNWYAGRHRSDDSEGYQFYTWDQEIVLDGRFRDRVTARSKGPALLFYRLRANDEFRVRFGDLVQRHLFNDGALTVEKAQQSWMRRANQIEKAIIAESARWGDAREGERQRIDTRGPLVTIPVMTIDLWRAERDNVHHNYLPETHRLAIERFQRRDLYPEVATPRFSQRGGAVPDAFQLQLEAAAGTVYFTTDGSDPRLVGGAVSPTASVYGEPIILTEDAVVRVRAKVGDQWSAIDEATFEVGVAAANQSNLKITEFLYHPTGDPDAEFIELQNVGPLTISLSGVQFEDGVEFDFTESQVTQLNPQQRVVVVNRLEAFAQFHDVNGLAIAGEFSDGRLADEGEPLKLTAADGSVIHDFAYGTPEQGWSSLAANSGHSLEVVDLNGDYAAPTNWVASPRPGGTPGRDTLIPGDSDRDGDFDSSDLVLVFQAGQYEDDIEQNSSWTTGDWNGDREFDSADIVFAFQYGAYEVAAQVTGRFDFSAENIDSALIDFDDLNVEWDVQKDGFKKNKIWSEGGDL